MSTPRAAKRYAKSLFSLAEEQGSDWSTWKMMCVSFMHAISNSPELLDAHAEESPVVQPAGDQGKYLGAHFRSEHQ